MSNRSIKTDICIIGAGPAGAAAALYLHYHGVPCVLLDKASFPRDKVCGDALSGKVITILNRISPDLLQRFYDKVPKSSVWGMKFVAPNRCEIDIPLKFDFDKFHEISPGFVSKRIDFDNFLVDEVKNANLIDFYENIEISEYEKTEDGYFLNDKAHSIEIRAKVLLVADGAQSRFRRLVAKHEKNEKHLAAGLRAYFKNVTGFHEDGFIELHFMDGLVPGYFWLFALPNGEANIGLGMRADYVKKKKLKLREVIMDVIANDEVLSKRFENAEMVGAVEGFPLPLGSKINNISGDNYMLLGDAGSLIDPLTGEGIGNGMYSGWIAAEQAIECLKQNQFDKQILANYDVRIKRVLGPELKLSYSLQKILVHKRLINFFARSLHKSQKLKTILCQMYLDLELRKKLAKPSFWLKLLTLKD